MARPVAQLVTTPMKVHLLKAALQKAETKYAEADRSLKAAQELSKRLKESVRDAKQAFKETRRIYKHARRNARRAQREERISEKEFRTAEVAVTRLRKKFGIKGRKKVAPAT
jgi:uncharacterized protein YPO0396